MIVVDTSAWVELLRRTGSGVHLRLRRLLEDDASLAATEVVIAELLAGARSPAEATALFGRLAAFPLLRLQGLRSYIEAAELARACRSAGEPVRSLLDCLVAVPAINAGATVLAADRDFEVLARHTPLELEPLQ